MHFTRYDIQNGNTHFNQEDNTDNAACYGKVHVEGQSKRSNSNKMK